MSSLPYVTAPGNITKALNGIASAATPERVTQDFVKEILKIPGGSGDQMASYLKKVGLANTDGSPTDRYRKFRNKATRGKAAADTLRHGYAALYKRNEYMHELSDAKLKGLIIEETGLSEESSVVGNTANCIKHIKAFAEFSAVVEHAEEVEAPEVKPNSGNSITVPIQHTAHAMGLNLSYTINLNLPATSDIAVFNAIFKSLKENLLSAGNE